MSNSGWMYNKLREANENQPEGPHIMDLLPSGNHVETKKNNPVNDRVDTFLDGVWSTDSPHAFP